MLAITEWLIMRLNLYQNNLISQSKVRLKIFAPSLSQQVIVHKISIESRILSIADTFEALTASDRPYKSAKSPSQSIAILDYMRQQKHIDSDLFELFLSSGIYLKYAKKFLKPEQIDDVNIALYLK